MNFIVAVDEEWNIGKDGDLLQRIPEDLKHFKAKTINKIIITGRKTLESFPEKKPLPGRINIVMTRSTDFVCQGAFVCHSYKELCQLLNKYNNEDVYVVGGGEIYNDLIPYCSLGYVTKIHKKYDADTSITNLDIDSNWTILESEGPYHSKDDICYSFLTYKNLNPLPLRLLG